MIKLDKEQLKAVYSKNKNILVSASAGTGKTTVLVDRVIHIILNNKIFLSEMVIITFTKNSANQLKLRIIEKLKNILNNTSDINKKKIIEFQLLNIYDNNIMTFHSYCNKIIKKYFEFLNINQNYEIVSEEYLNIIEKDIINKVYNYTIKNNKHYEELLNYFFINNNFEKIQETLLYIYKKTRNYLSYEKWKEKIKENIYNEKFIINLKRNILNQKKQELLKILEEINLFLEYLYSINSSIYIDYYINIKNFLENILFDFEKNLNNLNKIKFDKWKNDIKVDKLISKEIYNNYILLKKKINQYIEDILIEEEFISQQNFNNNLVFSFIKILDKVYIEISEYKKKRKILDFSDLEYFMCKLLDDKTIYNNIIKDLKAIFIDEYQDTSLIQEEILKKISKKSYLFIVGDIKQSIYGFRQANVKNFFLKRETYSLDNKKEFVILKKNYRSNLNILTFVNYINKIIFNNSDFYNEKIDDFEINDLLFNDNNIFWNFFINEKKNEQEINFIIFKIKEILGKEIIDSSGKRKKIGLNDIAILTRTKNNDFILELEKKLKKAEINYLSDITINLFNCKNITDILSLLKILENEFNNYDLLVVLKSNLCELTDLELQILLDFGKNQNIKDVFNMIKSYLLLNKKDNLTKKLNIFLQKKEKFFLKIKELKLSDFLLFLFEEDFYHINSLNIEENIELRNNINILLEISKEYNKKGVYNLYLFNNYLRKIKENKILFNTVNNISKNNYITISTIHKSKGLEYPIVFLVNLNTKISYKEKNNLVQISEDEGIAFKYIDDNKRKYINSYFFNHILKKNKKRYLDEEMRLIYVAITRCKERLYIFLENKTKKNLYLSDKINSFFDVFNKIFLSRTWKNIFYYKDEKNINILSSQEKNESKINSLSNRELEKVKSNYNKKYKYYYLTQKKQKFTVSELNNFFNKKDSNIDYNNNIIINNFIPNFIKEKKMNNMELGTLYHLILSLYNWDKNVTIDDIINKLSNRYINLEDLNKINIEDIYRTIKYISNKYITKGYEIYGKEINFSILYDAYNIYKKEEFRTEKIILQGRIDLLLHRNKELILIDYKMSKKDINLINKRYKSQINLYKKALSKKFKNYKINYDIVLI